MMIGIDFTPILNASSNLCSLLKHIECFWLKTKDFFYKQVFEWGFNQPAKIAAKNRTIAARNNLAAFYFTLEGQNVKI